MSDGAKRYPYTVLGQELDPNQALYRWDDDNLENHDRFFNKEVGGHLEAHMSFSAQVPTPANLCRTGGIVVVGGPRWSGKSSLINCCLNQIRKSAPDETLVHIFDFAGHQAKGPSVEERTNHVAKLIRIKMFPITKPEWVQRQLDEESEPSIESILMLLHTMWENEQQRKHSFLIVPPPLEFGSAAQEIERYRGCVDRGIVCVLEQVTGSNPPPLGPGRNQPIQLMLRHLRPGEAYKLVKTWPDTSTVIPPISGQVMTKFENVFMDGTVCELSIGILLATLREVYRRRIDGTSMYGQVDSIELEELVGAWRQVLKSQSTGQGNPPS